MVYDVSTWTDYSTNSMRLNIGIEAKMKSINHSLCNCIKYLVVKE